MANKVTDEEILKYVLKNPTLSVNKIGKELKVAKARVSKIKKENNIPSVRKTLSDENKEYIVQNFGIKTPQELADEFNFTTAAITRIWRENNMYSREDFNPDKEEFKEIYNNSRYIKEIANHYGKSHSCIVNFAEELGLESKHPNRAKLSPNEVEEIIELYNKDTSTNLAKHFNCSRSLILKIWMDNGLNGKDKGRQYYSNFDYFANIDSPDKAFYAGWIAADGCVYDRNNDSQQKMLSIGIHEKDEELIRKFLNEIQSNNPIIHRTQVTKKGILTPVSQVQIVSNKLCDDLAKYNIVPRKTWTFLPTNIPRDLMSHFIRGYFVGDGTITVANHRYDRPKYYNVSFIGNLKSMEYFGEYLTNIGIDNRVTSFKEGRYSRPFGKVSFVNNASKYDFLKFISEGSEELHLSRKKELIEKFFFAYENNRKNYNRQK
ncbi:hypothetical protein COA01_32695 [Bacillus cereus]|uniref:LAGLIDADG family homing endonuclease n=1 Tax=Bacillus cereus TaxID=1396 RepID=UPI000BFC3F35|nr:LAGLIDADG family homing endonuclease [Bacillus cereus]PGP12576.1 hypothetical protein COA01_32695 [Bacillus cereus]